MLASNIKNIAVYSRDMVNLGKVKDLEFDPSEMKVTNIIVEFQKEAAKEVLGKMIVLRHAKGRVRRMKSPHNCFLESEWRLIQRFINFAPLLGYTKDVTGSTGFSKAKLMDCRLSEMSTALISSYKKK